MPTPKAKELFVSDRQYLFLKKISQRETMSYNIVFRAKLLLHINEYQCSNTIAKEYFHCSIDTVIKWRSRWRSAYISLLQKEEKFDQKEYEDAIIQVLSDKSGRGVKPVFTEEQICQLYCIACENPEDLGYPITHWTPKELQNEMIKRQIVKSISQSSIARFLKRR